MRMRLRWLVPALLLATAALGTLVPLASAHKQLSAAGYSIEVGFHQEPALQNTLNGLDVVVTDDKTGKGAPGLSSTLKAEIAFGNQKRLLPLVPIEGQDGGYTGAVVPTDAGDYTFHVYGAVQGKPVDVSATSGPTSFSPVEPISAYAFPGTGDAAQANLVPQLANLRDQVDAANSTASTARWAAVAGIALGLAGIVIAIAALTRRRSA